MQRTPLANIDEKLDVIEHLNQDHTEELLVIANYYTNPPEPYEKAFALDMFEEGIAIEVERSGQKEEVYVPFTIKGGLEEKVIYLAYIALTKQGKDLKGNRQRFFEVLSKSKPSRNMMRIYIRSTSPLPEYYAGYTYGTVLKIIDKPKQDNNTGTDKSFVQRMVERFLIRLMGVLNTKNRMKLLQTLNKDIRLYTLRHSEKEHGEMPTLGSIDVFLHGNSPGSNWIKSLKAGDVILTRTSVEDKHHHLHEGSNVIIGDETAYPAIAGILELWQNSVPPIVILLYVDKADIDYFKEVAIPEGTIFHYVPYEGDAQAEPVLEILQKIERIDGAWGGFERESAKEVRHYVRNERGIDGKKNHIKGYWAVKDAKEA
ncbi:hypothetical protein AAEX37_00080 [Oligella sp. MSHR50489EDL]|uniref:siderophore-interacting protein n=1 Tax=Oligella sp. MSHR50489EDL TaxID=3139409 RepID=UPI003D81415C